MNDSIDPATDRVNVNAELREGKLQYDQEKEDIIKKFQEKEQTIVQAKEDLKESILELRQGHEEEFASLKAEHEKAQSELSGTRYDMAAQMRKVENEISELGQLQKNHANRSEMKLMNQEMDQLLAERDRLNAELGVNKDTMAVLDARQQGEISQLMKKQRIEFEAATKFAKEETKRLGTELAGIPNQRQQDLEILEKKYIVRYNQWEKQHMKEKEQDRGL